MADKILVAIVDDHPVVREGLKKMLEIGGDIEVIAEASSGLEYLQAIEQKVPDIVFMDIRMPGINGIEITRLVTGKYPNVRVVILTIYNDDQYVTEAIKAGARAYMLKNASRKEFSEVIDHVMHDRAFLDPKVTSSVFGALKKSSGTAPRNEKDFLTTRELEVLKAFVDGFKDREISEKLRISEHTVRSHVKSIFRKLNVSSRSRAATRAIQQGLVDFQ